MKHAWGAREHDRKTRIPDLGKKVAALRGGADRKAHGLAVLEAIRRINHRDLMNAPHHPGWSRMGAYRARAEAAAYADAMAEKRMNMSREELFDCAA